MTVQDLRIGNYILNEKGTPSEIREIKYNGCLFVEDNLWEQWLYNCDAIPLSEEWLLKLDFKSVGCYDNVYYHGDFRIYIDRNTGDMLLKYEHSSGNLEIEVSHIHQLQNLVYFLSGEELIVDL